MCTRKFELERRTARRRTVRVHEFHLNDRIPLLSVPPAAFRHRQQQICVSES